MVAHQLAVVLIVSAKEAFGHHLLGEGATAKFFEA